MIEELIETHAIGRIALQQAHQKMCQLGRRPSWYIGPEVDVLLVHRLKRVRIAGLEWRFPRETLVHYGPKGPQVRFRIIFVGHDHFRRHIHRRSA